MHKPMEFEEAERTYGRGRIRRAFTYKALNKLIQGSAADMTKKAMVDFIMKASYRTYKYTMNLIFLLSQTNKLKK